jgi:MYXO-CTERM domain-containing protein
LKPSLPTLSLALALAATFGAAPAGAVAYHESTQGDLASEGWLTMLALDSGTNTVTGTISVRGLTAQEAIADRDSFAFWVAPGQQLVSIAVELSDTVGNLAWARWSLYRSNSTHTDTGTLLDIVLWSHSPGSDAVGGNWGAGLYQLRNVNLAWFPSDLQPLAMSSYRIDLTVRDAIPAVPESGTWAMALGGLALLGARRLRRSKDRG